MKKILILALAALSTVGASAQKQGVDQAAKLSGKTADLAQARSLIQQAMNDEETKNDSRTYFVGGKLEFDAFDNSMRSMQVGGEVDPLEMGPELLNGYVMFAKAFPIDSVADAKGKVKAKHSKDMVNLLANHHNDYFNSGAQFYNAKMLYPQAFQSFMIYADMPDNASLGKHAPVIPDSVRATAYFNAGLSAYYGSAVKEAVKALKKARKLGVPQVDSYILEIASWQNIAQNDSTMEDAAKMNIQAIAQDGYNRFGMAQPLFFNNLVNYMVSDSKYDEALKLIDGELANNPELASLYGLKGFVYDRQGDEDKSVEAYRKAASIEAADFETLKNAAKKLFRVGQEKWNVLEGNSADVRQERQNIRENYFMAAKKIAEQAKAMNPDDGNLSDVIESIDYALTL